MPALAIVGRPNVGKSSLLNRLAGQDLAIVDPTPGTTRDTVDSIVERDGRSYRLVDTAGMRRSFQQAEGADYFAFVRSLEAVDRADVALLVLEAPQGVAEQDQKVAVRAVEAGCGLVLLANKWDLMDDEARRQFGVDLERKLYFVDWASMLRVSARTGRGVEKIWGLVDKVLAERSRRIPTAALNQWLGQADRAHAATAGAGPLGQGPLRHPGPGRPARGGPVHQRAAHPQLPPLPGAGPAPHLRVRGHAGAAGGPGPDPGTDRRRLTADGGRSRGEGAGGRDILTAVSGLRARFGTWRSLVSAPVWGTGGREFKSRRPDQPNRERWSTLQA